MGREGRGDRGRGGESRREGRERESARADRELKMNVFRLTGDFLHLLSIILLLYQIKTRKTCAGISLRTQELYGLVFVTRYLDIFYNFSSLYNTIFKIMYL